MSHKSDSSFSRAQAKWDAMSPDDQEEREARRERRRQWEDYGDQELDIQRDDEASKL